MKIRSISKKRKSVLIIITIILLSLLTFIFANGAKANDGNYLDFEQGSFKPVTLNNLDTQNNPEEHTINENGELVIIAKDEDGNVVSKVVNSNSSCDIDDGNNSVFHSHTWVPKYETRQVKVDSLYVVDQPAIIKSVTCCNVCGAKDVVYGVHQCNNGCFSSHTERVTVQQEIGHYIPVYGSEQYIEYYYCSECGVNQ